MDKPIMVYDGECGFCKRWIERWKIYTCGNVDYRTSQESAVRFPEIPAENFAKAVYLIESDSSGKRRITSAAEAVFRALAYNSSKRWLLAAYEKVPGIKTISEAFYKFVAEHRVLFSKLTSFFWGSDVKPSTYCESAFLYTRFLALIFGIAFFSFGQQIVGLVGKEGISPAFLFFEQIKSVLGAQRFWQLPTIFWLNSSDFFLQAVCYMGIAGSGLLFLGIFPSLLVFLLWFLYLSLVIAGQEFLSFQWDSLLLETALLSAFLVPGIWNPKNWKKNFTSEPPPLARFLLKWLIFRLMFLSGIVKLASEDPSWRSLSALNFHYFTQPLPAWTSWYAHQLPEFFQMLSTFLMFGIELVVPFFFFLPRRLRHPAALITIAFQFLILLTGNYCFFNWLGIALCLLLLDDSFWRKYTKTEVPAEKCVWESFAIHPARLWICRVVAVVVLLVSLSQMTWIAGGQRRRSDFFLARWTAPLRSINSYGLFAIMTTERNEIIIEGSADGAEWKTYEFKYKPGDPSRKPIFVQPLQPRLDWQMWFAALSSFQQNRWYINLLYRLLEGKNPCITEFFETNPFPDSPPAYIRSSYYSYRFSTPQERKEKGVWWVREFKGLYSPVMELK